MKTLAALLLVLTGVLAPAGGALAQGGEETEAFVLVATALLNNSGYRRTVILAMPTEGDRHIGLVLNRPLRRTLAELFPGHEPSKKVTEPVYFGGPMSQRAVFALVRSETSPGRGALRVLDGLYLAFTAASVDQVIEQWPRQARFFVGDVIWRPGELGEELGSSYWHVMNAHPDLLFRQETRELWEELSRRARALSARAEQASEAAQPAN